MRALASTTFTLALFIAAGIARAADQLPGLTFNHGDWELVCDNTGTCRAAGYQVDGAEATLSVLLTRKAGPGQPVTGALTIGDFSETRKKAPDKLRLALRIDERTVGPQINADADALHDSQVAALLKALRGSSSIAFTMGKHRWELSGKGGAAVLLKMDEFQRRLGTRGALLKPGAGSEDQVLAPQPALVVTTPALAPAQPGDDDIVRKDAKGLQAALQTTLGNDVHCPDLAEKPAFSLTRLSRTHLVVSSSCWSAMYNQGQGYWVIEAMPGYRPVLVTDSATEHNGGTISASHKGRGIGDCWSRQEWRWNGKAFVQTLANSSGMCKMVVAGGPWTLPRIVTEVREAPR
ncbi:MAG: DUF1176 domain-containing protein [Pseudomonadota bacterium]